MAHSTQSVRFRSAAPPRREERRWVAWLLSWLLGLVILAGAVGWRYDTAYTGRIFEGVHANGLALGGMTPAEALDALSNRLPVTDDERLIVRAAGEHWAADPQALGIHLDSTATVQEAFRLGRSGSLAQRWLARFALWRGSGDGSVQPLYTRDPVAVQALLTRIANEVAQDPQDSVLHIQGLSVSATPALPGRQLDFDASLARMEAALASGERTVELVVVDRAPYIVGAEETAAKAQALLAAPLLFFVELPEVAGEGYAPVMARRQWVIDRVRLAGMLFPFSRPLENGQVAWDVRLKPEGLRAEIEAIAAAITREPRDARFDFDPATGTLTPTVISQEGVRLDVPAAVALIEQAISEGTHEIRLQPTTIPPRVATADAAKFNLTGVAARGFSDYTGSAYERVVNVGVAASQYNGVVIPPGGEFSFNDHLGWVVDATGYEEGYIISGNKTEVDVGGGVCQVSTTVFRAAMEAGFEIIERHAHAYRVPYYENGSALGYDATVFSPWVDFRFRNNTDHYYLMEVENDPAALTLAINLYGPPTGRTVEIVSTVVEETAHGPDLYETDPALAPGVVKQVDWAHSGAIIKLERIVRDANGSEIGRDEFWSEYKPWQARFLVGPGAGGN